MLVYFIFVCKRGIPGSKTKFYENYTKIRYMYLYIYGIYFVYYEPDHYSLTCSTTTLPFHDWLTRWISDQYRSMSRNAVSQQRTIFLVVLCVAITPFRGYAGFQSIKPTSVVTKWQIIITFVVGTQEEPVVSRCCTGTKFTFIAIKLIS